MSDQPDIAVINPCYNEATTVTKVVGRFASVQAPAPSASDAAAAVAP